MLSRAFEWYRIAEIRPNSQTIDKRIAAVKTVIEQLDEAEDWDLGLSCAAGVVAGFDKNFTQESVVVKSLVGAIKANESAFPEDLSENALALRACAALAIGELLTRHGDEEPSSEALTVATIMRSGLGVRPSPKGKHLKKLLEDLDQAARSVLEAGAISRRERSQTLDEQLTKLAQPAELTAAVKELARQSTIEREELNILWWIFSGSSSTVREPMAQMPVGAAALCCGAELAGQCLLPPNSSLEAMVRRAYETGRKSQEITPTSLVKIVADWDKKLAQVLVPDEDAQEFAQAYPALFPLSWVSKRLLDGGAKSWATEYEHVTDRSANYALPPSSWAVQAFWERVTQRALTESLED